MTINHAWTKVRLNHLALYPECRVCGSTQDPQVHHIRYRGKRGLSELPGDLVTLCAEHHQELHRLHDQGVPLDDHSIAYIRQRAIELAVAGGVRLPDALLGLTLVEDVREKARAKKRKPKPTKRPDAPLGSRPAKRFGPIKHSRVEPETVVPDRQRQLDIARGY